MTKNESKFNLVDEPWIPAAYLDGHQATVSLRQAFEDAPNILELAGDIPEQVQPILGIMLAILYKTAPYPYEDDSPEALPDEQSLREFWKQVWDSGHFFTEEINEYLDCYHRRFYLVDDEYPFYQVAGLEYANKEPDGVDELIADVPKPEKFLFSMRDRNRITSLSFAEAARWLIFQQAYSPAGIKTPVKGNTHVKSGKVYPPKGAVGTGLFGAQGGVYLEGKNLFETLMLNWVLCDSKRGLACLAPDGSFDLAPWERENPMPDLRISAPNEPNTIAQALTWQSRRMRLVPSEDGSCIVGVICCYGDIPNVVDKQDVETMTAWRLSPTQQKKLGTSNIPFMPKQHDPSRAAWRGLASLVAVQPKSPDLRPEVIRWIDDLQYREVLSDAEVPMVAIHAQGMSYGTQSSTFEDGIDDKFELSVTLARHDLASCNYAVEVVDQTDQSVRELSKFVLNVERAKGDKSEKTVWQAKAGRIREVAYGRLDGICRDRIAKFPADVDEAVSYCNEWRRQIRGVILSLANDYILTSDAPLFEEHGDMTTGKALLYLQINLNKILETAGKAASADTRSTEGM